MDDPFSDLVFLQNGECKHVEARRVYHINVILALRENQSKNEVLFHYLLDINRNGIIRIEFIRRT